MIEQLKLLLDAAQWRTRDEQPDVDYEAWRASKALIESLKSAVTAAEELAEITSQRPANYDPYAQAQE